MVRALIYGVSDISMQSDDGKTPIDLALEAGNLGAAKVLQEGIHRQFKPKPK